MTYLQNKNEKIEYPFSFNLFIDKGCQYAFNLWHNHDRLAAWMNDKTCPG